MHGLHIAGAPLDCSGVVLTIIRASYVADDKRSMLPSQLVLRLDCIKYFCYASSSALYTVWSVSQSLGSVLILA